MDRVTTIDLPKRARGGLSDKERRVLTAIHIAPLADIPEIARRIKLSSHVVRHTVQQLRKENIIGYPVPFVDVYALGYTEYAFYLTVSQQPGAEFDSILESDRLSIDGVSLVSQIAGPYNLLICLYARSVSEANERFSYVIDHSMCHVVKKTVSTRISLRYFGYRYFGSDPKMTYPMRHFGLHQPTLDPVINQQDRKILAGMGKSGSRRELARTLTIPSSTLDHRIRRLEKLGVIQGYEYLFSPGSLGKRKYRLLIGADPKRGETLQLLLQLVKEDPRVVVVNECLGDWEYEIIAHLQDGESVGDFCDLVAARLKGAIRTLYTITEIRRHRLERYPFAAEEESTAPVSKQKLIGL